MTAQREIVLSLKRSEFLEFVDHYAARRSVRGWEAALDYVRVSPLVREVRVDSMGDEVLVLFKDPKVTVFPSWLIRRSEWPAEGQGPYTGMTEEEILQAKHERTREEWNKHWLWVVQDIQKHLGVLSVGMLVVVGESGQARYFANQMRTLAEGQLLHVARGGSSETLPQGPLKTGDPVLRQVATERPSP